MSAREEIDAHNMHRTNCSLRRNVCRTKFSTEVKTFRIASAYISARLDQSIKPKT